MQKRKLILYSPELGECPNYDRIFKREYEVTVAGGEQQFLSLVRTQPADAAILCLCSPCEELVDDLLLLDAVSGPLPVLTCCKIVDPEFIRRAAQKGASRILICDADLDCIRSTIDDTIRDQGLWVYLNSCWPEHMTTSPHTRRLIEELIYAFPHRLTVRELSRKLGIGRGWLCRLCKDDFGIPVTALVRRLWIYQALRMMQYTNLDNLEIALHLQYSQESSMARDFRKEVGCSPNEARYRLSEHTPEELLLHQAAHSISA